MNRHESTNEQSTSIESVLHEQIATTESRNLQPYCQALQVPLDREAKINWHLWRIDSASVTTFRAATGTAKAYHYREYLCKQANR